MTFSVRPRLTREPVTAAAYALEEVTVAHVERHHLEELVSRKPVLLHELGRAIEDRRRAARHALSAPEQSRGAGGPATPVTPFTLVIR